MAAINPTRRQVLWLVMCLAACGETPGPGTGSQGSTDTEAADTVASPLPDFGSIADVPTLKRTFYAYLHPLVKAENDRIRGQRQRLQHLLKRRQQGGPLPAPERAWIINLSRNYEAPLAGRPITPTHIDSLLIRVDIVPAQQALAQAAVESGWGRSRFARLGNNIYGEWCFVPGCGIVPRDRARGASHEIADFESPAGSVRSFMHNLNTHYAYADWRAMRRRQRDEGTALNARELAAGLTAYSTLRREYVRRIRTIMRQNADLIPSQ